MSLSEYGLQDRGQDKDKDKGQVPHHLSGKGHGTDQDIGDRLSCPDSERVYPELPGFFFRRFAQVGDLPFYDSGREVFIGRKFPEFCSFFVDFLEFESLK